MQSQNRLFNDLARVASGAAGALAGVRSEVEEAFRQKLERYLAQADMVPRDEFDAIKAVAVKAREAQEGLEVRIAALEVEITKLKKSATRNPRKKAALNTSD
jgi:BMFP domain-containing protein YqiC